MVGGIGLVTGLLALAQPLLGTIDTLAALIILSVGLLLAGIVDLAGLIVGRSNLGARLGRVLASGVHLLLGVMLLYLTYAGTAGNALLLLGVVGIVLGALLMIYGVILYRRPVRSP